MHKQQTFVAY